MMNAWQRSGHWVCKHGAFLLAHQECRCLEEIEDDLLVEDILRSRSAERIQTNADDAEDDCRHTQLPPPVESEPLDDGSNGDLVLQQPHRPNVSSQREIREEFLHPTTT